MLRVEVLIQTSHHLLPTNVIDLPLFLTSALLLFQPPPPPPRCHFLFHLTVHEFSGIIFGGITHRV